MTTPFGHPAETTAELEQLREQGSERHQEMEQSAGISAQDARSTQDYTARLKRTIGDLEREMQRRETVEAALRESEQRFQVLYDNNPTMYFTLSPEGMVLSVNRYGSEQLGYRADELIGGSVLAVFKPEDHATVLDQLTVCRTSLGQLFDWEIRKIRKDGSTLWVKERAQAVRDQAGRILVLVVCEDVTTRRLTEEMVRESEERWRALFEQAGVGMAQLSMTGQFLRVNPRLCETLGYASKTLLQRTVQDLTHPDDLPANLDYMKELLTGKRPSFSMEKRYRRSDDVWVWVDLTVSLVRNASSAPAYFIAVVQNIDDRKLAEDQLRESEQAIRSLHEATSDPGLSIDQRIQTVLELGCRRFRLPIGIVTDMRGDELELTHVWAPGTRFTPGMRVPLCQSYCATTLESKGVVSFEHAKASEWSRHPGYKTLGLECYIGTKVQGQSKIHGTISFLSAKPRPTPFNEADKDFLLLMAQWIAAESDRRQAELRLESINQCFLQSGGDPLENVQRLTALCGELLEGTCALYSRLEGKFLCAVGQWKAPSNFTAVEKAEGHLCSDLIRCGVDQLMTVRHLPGTSYAKTDPNVGLYRLQTYIGQVVSIDEKAVGSLSVVFQRDFIPTEADERLMGILAAAIGTEEQRIRAQKALRASEERFAKAFRSSPYPVMLTMLDSGECLEVNDAAFKLFGYERDEVIGRTTVDLGLWPVLEQRETFFERLRREGAIRNYEVSLRAKNGAIRQLLVSSEIIELHGSTCLLSVGNDITEQKQAEAALRNSELQLQRFVSDAPVGLVIMDAQKRLLSANKAFCTLTGYSEEEIVGKTFGLYTHPDDLSRNFELTEEFFSGKRTGYTYEKRYVRKQGDVIWVSVKATPIELPTHQEQLLLAVVENITESKRATETKERLSQDLHDNLLQSLYAVGMQLEASTIAAGTSARKSKVHAKQAIDQLNHLVGDVRHFIALLKQGTSPQVDFGGALHQLVSAFSAAGHRAPELDIEDGVLDLIDSTQAEQLLNIAREALSNSVRHAQAGHRSICLSRLDRTVRMQICDDGIGFIVKLKRKQGHGLANMAARAKKIRARLRLTSKPNQGTCVTVDLPMEGST